MKLTENFTLEEMVASTAARYLSLDNTPDAEQTESLRKLCENVLQPLRELWGGPIKVTSGYRCDEVNEAVGGVPHSQHTKGEAADIKVGDSHQNQRLARLLMKSGLPFDQLIIEQGGTWLHISHAWYRANRGRVLYS